MEIPKVSVLIIEDDREDYEITLDVLSQITDVNYKVEWEQDFQKALQRISLKVHDVYLIDYNLGPYSGVDIVKQSNAIGINVPFIFLTGMNDVNVDKEAMSAGATDYLIKNDLNPGLLERSIRYAIKQKEIESALLASNSTKDKLFSIISHDLRAPIGTFITTIELLTKTKYCSEELKQELLLELAKTSKSTLNLLDNLLCWSRCQLGSIAFVPEEISLIHETNDIFELFDNRANQKQIQLTNLVTETISVHTDANFFRTILRNLVSNAIKFTNNQGNIIVDAKETEDTITVSVKDNGVGMDAETQEKLLMPHIFETTQGTNNEAGSGLGLKIVQEFVIRAGGTMCVESAPDLGSTFYFTIPKNSPK